MKKCPFCAEDIDDDVIICSHCGRDASKAPAKHNAAPFLGYPAGKAPSKDGCYRLILILTLLPFCVGIIALGVIQVKRNVMGAATRQVYMGLTATAESNTTYISDPIEVVLHRVEGPREAFLQLTADFVSKNCMNMTMRNFAAEASFYNPYPPSVGEWDYGFMFRHVGGNDQFRLYINSDGEWQLIDATSEPKRFTSIAQGSVALHVQQNEVNRLKIIAYKERGYFYVNGVHISTLDLSSRMDQGDVCIAAGFVKEAELSDYSTRYEDFSVWSLSSEQ